MKNTRTSYYNKYDIMLMYFCLHISFCNNNTGKTVLAHIPDKFIRVLISISCIAITDLKKRYGFIYYESVWEATIN